MSSIRDSKLNGVTESQAELLNEMVLSLKGTLNEILENQELLGKYKIAVDYNALQDLIKSLDNFFSAKIPYTSLYTPKDYFETLNMKADNIINSIVTSLTTIEEMINKRKDKAPNKKIKDSQANQEHDLSKLLESLKNSTRSMTEDLKDLSFTGSQPDIDLLDHFTPFQAVHTHSQKLIQQLDSDLRNFISQHIQKNKSPEKKDDKQLAAEEMSNALQPLLKETNTDRFLELFNHAEQVFTKHIKENATDKMKNSLADSKKETHASEIQLKKRGFFSKAAGLIAGKTSLMKILHDFQKRVLPTISTLRSYQSAMNEKEKSPESKSSKSSNRK